MHETVFPPTMWKNIEYLYDASGRRVQKIVDGTDGFWYIFDGYQMIEERTFKRSVPETILRRQVVYGTEVNAPIYIYDPIADDNYYLLKNDQNTVLALYKAGDVSGQAPREQYEYSGYGITNMLNSNGQVKMFDHDSKPETPTVKQVKSDWLNPFGYQGMWRDEHTGLYHTHYRLYDPQHVRWLTPDPAGYRDGQNLYRFYAGPNGVDVLGLDGYFFEGTGNHPFEFNPKCHRDGEKRNYVTNVKRMFDAYIGGNATYIYGIGSGFYPDGKPYAYQDYNFWGWAKNFAEIRLEGGAAGSFNSRVDYAIKQFEKNLKNNSPESRLIDVVGFSRGSTEALEFLNRISDGIEAGIYPSDIKIRSANFYDAVGSVGWSGKTDVSDMGYRFSLPEKLTYLTKPFHAIAMDEKRAEFQVIDIKGAIQMKFRGVHSDIGGGYDPLKNFLMGIPLFTMLNNCKFSGLNIYDTTKIKYGNLNYASLVEQYTQMNNAFGGIDAASSKFFPFNMYTPTDNSSWEYNDNEVRTFPSRMYLSYSIDWLKHLDGKK